MAMERCDGMLRGALSSVGPLRENEAAALDAGAEEGWDEHPSISAGAPDVETRSST
jgi:hypothetical protein